MNLKLVAYNLGIVCLLIAIAMVFSLVWALPCFGGDWMYEMHGVSGLIISMLTALICGGAFLNYGYEGRTATLFRREAIAVVGLSWLVAVILGSLPYLFSETGRDAILNADGTVTIVPMSVADALFESVSGFTTTGASIMGELENPAVISRCVLFWRSTTHFIGGLGIIVLLVALLDTGISGKSLVQREMSGPKQSTQYYSRIQGIVRRTASVYLIFNVVLIGLLIGAGMSVFDAICHAFGTISTGGMGTHNTSLIYFQTVPSVNAAMVEWSMGIFLFLSGMNILLLSYFMTRKFRYLFQSVEWRMYVIMVVLVTASVCYLRYSPELGLSKTIRYSFFEVVSTCTTGGFACDDYTLWLPQAQAFIMLLMAFTACSGSTCGGPKCWRYIVLYKMIRAESERFYRPNDVRPIKFNGEVMINNTLTYSVALYFAMAGACIGISWMLLMLFEPNTPWLHCAATESKAGDLFVATVSQFSNVGPGLGVFGPMNSYGFLSSTSKCILALNMLIGRLEFFGILTLLLPSFWRK